MDWPIIVLIIVASLLGAGLFFSLFFTFLIAYIVYVKTLKRDKHTAWGREHCSEPGCEPLEEMWRRGLAWAENNKEYKKEVFIKSKDGLKLVGEWYDYGFDKTIIILPGRRETLVYSYYYANPYKDAGLNVLVIDHRAHGFSEGTYSTCGIKEAEDVSLWMKYLHDEMNQKEIYLHGICVGTVVSSLLATKYRTDYLKAVILDSTFISYKEIYKNHFIEGGHAIFPVFYQVWFWFWLFTHCNINNSSPIKYMPEFKLPVLFIWGEKDIYCLQDKSKQIIEKCASEDKQVEWFEGAMHSRIRLSNEEHYDGVIKDFLARHM